MEGENRHMSFKPVNEGFVLKQFNSTNAKKATGYDNLSVKMLKLSSQVKANLLSNNVNRSFIGCIVQNSMKIAQVVLIHKKNIEPGKLSPCYSTSNSFKDF